MVTGEVARACGAAGHDEGCTEVSHADAAHEICVQVQIWVHYTAKAHEPYHWLGGHSLMLRGMLELSQVHLMPWPLTSRCISTQQSGDF